MKKITIKWSWKLERDLSKSTAVVIDVNAATTNLAIMLSKKVGKLIIVNESNLLTLKKRNPQALVIGESSLLPQKIFQASNLPPSYLKLDLQDKTILYLSNNGSRVIESLSAQKAKNIITASFVNINAVADYLRKREEPIILVCAGEKYFPDKKAWEDWYCAEALKGLISGKEINLDSYLKKSKAFILSAYDWQDIKIASEVIKIEHQSDSFPLIPTCYIEKDGLLVIKRQNGL